MSLLRSLRWPRGRLWLLLLVVALALALVEAHRAYSFYSDLTDAQKILQSIRVDIDLISLEYSEDEILDKRAQLEEAGRHLRSAKTFTKTDPFLNLAAVVPIVGNQSSGLRTLVFAAEESARVGIRASDVALAFKQYEGTPGETSLQGALDFIGTQEEPMADLRVGLVRIQDLHEELPGDLLGPLDRAARDLEKSVTKLDQLVEGYERANAFLPGLFGADSQRTYLLLPQNDTELFPSGGLISSYGVVSFTDGRLGEIKVESFATLFDRWQESTGEYIEPPAPLKNYLKKDLSWALGEAGWYPDFPTTANLAREFTGKAGVAPTDGVIAIDLKFLVALLEELGPVRVPDYGVSVTPQNAQELILELTRDEAYVPGLRQPGKAFLGYLARALIDDLLSAPKEEWIDLLELLNRMGGERHLQLNFNDPDLQELSVDYGLDGGLQKTEGDFLLIADTSVNSTKLNLILEPSARLEVYVLPDDRIRSVVTYEIRNPFPEWSAGRNPALVRDLMLGGVYGSYTRVYVPADAILVDVWLDGERVGAEQVEAEFDKKVFGRFFRVPPGAKSTVQFAYEMPIRYSEGTYRYRLDVQKESGTEAVPFEFRLVLRRPATLEGLFIDGVPIDGNLIVTDLRTDRHIEAEIRFSK